MADAQTAYRANTPTSVLKWRHQSQDDREVPVRVNCWPSAGDGKVIASVEYELSRGYELVDFVVTIPIVFVVLPFPPPHLLLLFASLCRTPSSLLILAGRLLPS